MSSFALPVIDQIAASMSASSLQNQLIAGNIANRETVGYQRLKLRFDDAMDQAGAATIVADTVPEAVSIEQDLVALSANAMHYQAMARVLSHYFSVISAITNSSRG